MVGVHICVEGVQLHGSLHEAMPLIPAPWCLRIQQGGGQGHQAGNIARLYPGRREGRSTIGGSTPHPLVTHHCLYISNSANSTQNVFSVTVCTPQVRVSPLIYSLPLKSLTLLLPMMLYQITLQLPRLFSLRVT